MRRKIRADTSSFLVFKGWKPAFPTFCLFVLLSFQPSRNRVFPTEWQGERKYANVFSYLAEPYNYYTRIFGKSITSQYLDLFFLNRRGGYALPDGIILSQEYISKNNSSFTKEEITRLVAHEVAHLWWGIGVKGKSWAITEGLAELQATSTSRILKSKI